MQRYWIKTCIKQQLGVCGSAGIGSVNIDL